jgi:hypothetical protein
MKIPAVGNVPARSTRSTIRDRLARLVSKGTQTALRIPVRTPSWRVKRQNAAVATTKPVNQAPLERMNASGGDQRGVPRRKTVAVARARRAVVRYAVVTRRRERAPATGRKRISTGLRPSWEIPARSTMAETVADCTPTAWTSYLRAAIAQKMSPRRAVEPPLATRA